MARAFVFPGQGSQAVGMGADLAGAFATARDVFHEVDEALKRLAEQSRPFAPKGEGAKAANGDRVIIDFTGKIDGVAFEGGTGGDVGVGIGSNTFIPGFEEQLIGLGVGDKHVVKVTFPQSYPAAHLAGKAAEFDVVVKSVDAPKDVAIDDEFAKQIGLESLDKLKETMKQRLQQEHAAVSRQKVKRQLLDELDAKHKFTPPPSLVAGWLQPPVAVQPSCVQGLLSSQSTGLPLQAPASQASPLVQALPSSQTNARGRCEHPLSLSHTSAVHT